MGGFINGAIALSYAVAGLFFLKYWRSTHDRLFSMFAGAFWLLAIHRLVLTLTGEAQERSAYVYLLRLFAFIVILIAIADKNRTRKSDIHLN